MTSKKMYACYRTDEADIMEFWSFNKTVYDAFVETFVSSISRFPCKHVIIPSYRFYDDFNSVSMKDRMLNIYDISDQPVLATQFYIDMFWECGFDDIISSYLSTYQLVSRLPHRLNAIINRTMWNRHIPEDCVDSVKMFYLMMNSYFSDKDVFELLMSDWTPDITK